MQLETAINLVKQQNDIDQLRHLYCELMNYFSADPAAIWAIQEATCAARDRLTSNTGE